MKLFQSNALQLVAMLSIALLAGCASLIDSASGAKSKGPNKLTDFKSTATLDIRWKSDLGDGGGNALQPAVTSDAVYAANSRGEIFRLERLTGKQVWRVESGFAITGGVGAGDGLVLVGGGKGDLAAFEQDGKLRWKIKVSSEILSAPQISNGIVVVRTGDGRIAGLSAVNGSRQWLYERATPVLIVRNHAGVSIASGTVFAGFAGGRLALIGLSNGIVKWDVPVSQPRGNTELERISDITSLPVTDDEQVCAVAFQGNVACFDIAQGNPLWSREISSDKGVALDGKVLYLTDATGTVSALDKSSGSSLWKNDQLSLRRTSAPYVTGKYVAVGDYAGYVHLLSREDGAFAARFKTEGGSIVATPTELDGGLLVQTASGGLYSLAIH